MNKILLRLLPKFILEKYGVLYRQLSSFRILSNTYGQFNSIKTMRSIDAEGNVLPWYTYSSIEFLKQINFKQKNIFEYGSGYSSLFWANRAKSVISVENNEAWHKEIITKALKNQKIVLCKNRNDYIGLIEKFNKSYDVIIIDGEERYKCAKKSLTALKNGGFIILDNSERYPRIAKMFRDNDLIQIDFYGFGPINGYTWVTSLFLTREYYFKPINRQPKKSIGGEI